MKRICRPVWGVLVSLSLFSFIVISCNRSNTAPAGNAQGTETSNVQYSAGTIPDGFPGDVPVYKNIKSSKAISGGVNLLHLQSDDTKKQIIEYYTKELTAAQWQLTEEGADDTYEILARKQQRSVTVSIRDKGAAGRVIDISY